MFQVSSSALFLTASLITKALEDDRGHMGLASVVAVANKRRGSYDPIDTRATRALIRVTGRQVRLGIMQRALSLSPVL